MSPDFSEFSYGYAFTEELVASLKASIIGAPIFPSLYEEGKKGGGYDLKVPLVGKPVFLQFKLSDWLKKRSAREHQQGLLDVPYYRMHLRPLRHSDQHDLLLDLEATGETVFYVAPEFHLPGELNEFYLNKAIILNSAAFSPSDIGPLPDDEAHYVVFERGSSLAYRCTGEPLKFRKRSLKEGFGSLLSSGDTTARALGIDGMRGIGSRMLDVLGRAESRLRVRAKSVDLEGVRRIFSERNPVEAVGYVARTFFDAELAIIPQEF
jgi:hypothetical protein